VFGFGRLLGNVIFYRLFRNDMEYAYRKLDSSESEVQARVEELLKSNIVKGLAT
jgi:DNA-binding Lrp family transcriptional regulator